jgi:hypothetical protein
VVEASDEGMEEGNAAVLPELLVSPPSPHQVCNQEDDKAEAANEAAASRMPSITRAPVPDLDPLDYGPESVNLTPLNMPSEPHPTSIL